MVAHQVNDEIEDLGLDMNGFAKPAQFMLAEVDLELGKPVQHYHLSLMLMRYDEPATIRRLNDIK